jgi:hypothetical protein
MICVRRKKRGIPYAQKWFARSARSADLLGLVAYYQYLGARPPALFTRRPFSTVLIDLCREPEAVLADMHRNVRYEIRRADTEGLLWEPGVDPAEFVSFHDAFATERRILGVDIERLLSFGSTLLLSRVRRNGRTLAQHAYIVDPVEKRARFLYSSSGRFLDGDAALVGRANRWCHWKDMLHLRGLGMCTYDLGGIAAGSADPTLLGIDEFKLRFGGTVVREDHWMSPLYLLTSLAGAQ